MTTQRKQWVSWEEFDALFPGLTPYSIVDFERIGGLTPGSIPFADAAGILTEYNSAFFFDESPKETQIYDSNSYIRTHSFVGKVLEYDKETGIAKIMQRNPLFDGEEIEVVQPNGDDFVQKVENMINPNGDQIVSTPHAQMLYYMKMKNTVRPGTIFMKKKSEEKNAV